MVLTNSDAFAERARSLKSLAYGRGAKKFMHEAVGFNYRMPNTIAALGCAQFKKIDRVIEMKRDMAAFYGKELSGIEFLQLPVEKDYAKNVYWMYHVVLRGKWRGRREDVLSALRQRGIETREAFVPYNQQEIFIKNGLVRPEECPVANDVGENGFYLPSGPLFVEGELQFVADVVKSILK